MNKPKKESLLDQIRNDETPLSGRTPKVFKVLELLDETDRTDLLQAFDDHTIPARAISRVLAKRDIILDAPSITRYRRGELIRVIKR